MKGKDVFCAMQYLDEKFIDQAEFGQFSAKAFYGDLPQKGMRSHRKVFLLAAAIALAALLVGCGVVYMLKMQNLKLGQAQVTEQRWDKEQHAIVDQTVSQQALTLSGLKGTPSYQAAQEWYEFEQTYDPDHQIYYATKDNPTEFPEKYKFYNPYSQEIVDKIEEICDKYDLQLIGAPVKAQNVNVMMDYLGIDSILLPDAPAEASPDWASYYEGGYFRTDVTFRMTAGEDAWPFHSMLSYHYSPKNCFNNDLFELTGEDWQERNYTTSSGHDVLILRSPTVWESWVFCDLGDATVTLRVETINQVYTDENGYQEVIETSMTEEQLNQILDTINFDLEIHPGDPSILEGQKSSTNLVQTQNGYTIEVKQVFTDGHRTAITLELTAPEDVDLEQYLNDPGIYFNRQEFEPTTGDIRSGNGALSCRADNDGKANTIEIFGVIERNAKEGLAFPKGITCNLYLENLYAGTWGDPFNALLSVEGVWNFDITLEEGDWQALEFVSDPITMKVSTGWDANGNDVFEDVTITSLTLRRFGGMFTSTWDKGVLDMADYRAGKLPTVVLKDGTEISLSGSLDFYYVKDEGTMIPLGEVDHLVLMDGTVLYPVE